MPDVIKFYYKSMLGEEKSSLTATTTFSSSMLDYNIKNIHDMLEAKMWKASSTTHYMNQYIMHDCGDDTPEGETSEINSENVSIFDTVNIRLSQDPLPIIKVLNKTVRINDSVNIKLSQDPLPIIKVLNKTVRINEVVQNILKVVKVTKVLNKTVRINEVVRNILKANKVI